jgi:hypothetical protein
MLQATATNGKDLAACDPSVVYYQGLYYLYYSSAVTTASKTYQTVIQVARSASLDGPYLTYTQRRTWEDTPRDPQVLVYPLQMHSTQPAGYGAGQQSVVVQNGNLLMWYTDDSIFVDGQPQVKTYLLKSSDPVTWSPAVTNATNLIGQASMDVKYDASQSQFVMIRVENEFTSTSYLARRNDLGRSAKRDPRFSIPPLHARRWDGGRRDWESGANAHAGWLRSALESGRCQQLGTMGSLWDVAGRTLISRSSGLSTESVLTKYIAIRIQEIRAFSPVAFVNLPMRCQ